MTNIEQLQRHKWKKVQICAWLSFDGKYIQFTPSLCWKIKKERIKKYKYETTLTFHTVYNILYK